MTTTRIALANLPIPATREAAVDAAVAAIAEAGRQGALILCFPECFIPGYRWPGAVMPAPDAGFLAQAVRTVAAAAKAAGVAEAVDCKLSAPSASPNAGCRSAPA